MEEVVLKRKFHVGQLFRILILELLLIYMLF